MKNLKIGILPDLIGHYDAVTSICYSSDGKYIASGSNDFSIRIWKTDEAKTIAVFNGHENDVNSISFSPNGKLIVSGSSDETVRVWNINEYNENESTEENYLKLEGHKDIVN